MAGYRWPEGKGGGKGKDLGRAGSMQTMVILVATWVGSTLQELRSQHILSGPVTRSALNVRDKHVAECLALSRCLLNRVEQITGQLP